MASNFDLSREFYQFTNGWTMFREGSGGFWHLRNRGGDLIDKDRYRHDLMPRHDLVVEMHHDPK